MTPPLLMCPRKPNRLRPAWPFLVTLTCSVLALLASALATDVPSYNVPAPSYTLTDLGSAGPQSEGTAINDFGDAVGFIGNNAFLYHRDHLINLGALLPSNSSSSAHSINLEGQVVGVFFGFSPFGIGFLYSDGQIQTLTGPNGESANPSSISNVGQIVGTLQSTQLGVLISHVFLRQPTGQITDLGTFGGTETPIASNPGLAVGAFGNAINDVGQIAGVFVAQDGHYHAFLAQPGGTNSKDLGTLGGDAWANALNDFGQVVGYCSTGVLDRAFLYSGAKMRDLGTLPGGTSADAFGINIFGQVVGSSDVAGEGEFGHGFVYLYGQMLDLNELLSPDAKGWLVFFALGINDLGQIVGSAVDAAGTIHSVILTPHYR
jgi:probable HAF family extracellular repeat protein